MSDTTPMMIQYNEIKKKYPDAILFYRLGDFYEMFRTDAAEACSILNLTLTKRHGIPMCGIPYHAAQSYVGRLLKAGKKIAVCEQVSLPEKGKGIAKREVVEVLTPGTIVDQDFLDNKENNYIMCLAGKNEILSVSYMDLSTGIFESFRFPEATVNERLRRELTRLNPSEIIIQESIIDSSPLIKRILEDQENLVVNRFADWNFYNDQCEDRLKEHFKVSNLKAFGLAPGDVEILSAGSLLGYLEETSHSLIEHVRHLELVSDQQYMGLDESALRNLEILKNQQDRTSRYTLLSVMDKTRTAMGARTLRQWLTQPLINMEAIKKRQDLVEEFYRDQNLISSIRETLSGILDLERLTARIAMDKAHGKDLIAVRDSLKACLRLKDLLADWYERGILLLDKEITDAVVKTIDLLEQSICEEPSILLTEGRLIKEGYNKKLDHYRVLKEDSQRILKDYIEGEKESSGIPNLKIKYNKIIGHFIEVTKSNLTHVPDYFIRRQSLVNAERFTTEKLAVIETELNAARDSIVSIERELFLEIRSKVKEEISFFQLLSRHIADIDVLSTFAYDATHYGWIRPEINNENILNIQAGRHPVVEENIPPGSFIPNETVLGQDGLKFALITGPNMAGKSTYLRQTALIVLMAQVGSFVPASRANIGLIDKIFCRVGASDNLARGESTFLVEMNETAFILRTATKNSLIIMDEVGRGTSTNDGLSIAWAVSEHILHDLQAMTLFATHYHELTGMKEKNLINLSMDVRETDGDIVFLKKIKKSPASSSYGIHVARLAGLPLPVVKRAEGILSHLKNETLPLNGISPEKNTTLNSQPNLFPEEELIVKEIQSLDINTTTPLEALNILNNLKGKIEKL